MNMRAHWILFIVIAACLAGAAATQLPALHESAGGAEPSRAEGARVLKLFDASPALFVKNEGQWADASIRYGFHGSGANVLFTDDGLRLQVFRRKATEKPTKPTGDDHPFTPPHDRSRGEGPPTQFTELSVRFEGANQVAPTGLEQNNAVFNYYIGDQANWRTGVPTYATVAYQGLYYGIHLHTRGRRNSLKYEFHVAPGADYRQIRISYRGVEGLYIDADGALHVASALGELVDEAPYIYQEIGGKRIEVAGRFELVDADTYTFSIAGAYDPRTELVIDPDLTWASFLGGGANDCGYGIAVDVAGNALITGHTHSSDFPTPGGFDTSHDGGYDAFVAKVSGTGSLLWASFLGGGAYDHGFDIAVDGNGNAFLTGQTHSSDFPTPGGFDTTHNGGQYDAFVAKVSGTGSLLWASFLGGGAKDRGSDIAVDGAGSALITGYTTSTDFPTPGGFDTSYDGECDAFVAKVSGAGSLLWASFLGGGSPDYGGGIAVDWAGHALITGYTKSSDFPTPGGSDTSHNGTWDAFVAKISGSGGLLWASFLGGGSPDHGYGIAVDAAGNALITGYTASSDFPTPGGFDTSHDGWSDAFVAKVSGSGSLLWASFLGGGSGDYGRSDDYGRGIAVDGAGNALITGFTASPDFPTPDGSDTSYNGGDYDAFVAKVSGSGSLLWASFLGGGDTDFGEGVAVDGAGSTLITGWTDSSDFPTPGGFDTSHNGGRDAFVAKIGDPVGLHIEALELFYAGRSGNAADPAKTFLAVGEASSMSLVGTDLFGNVTNYLNGITGIRVTFDTVVTFSVDAAVAFSYEATPEQTSDKTFTPFTPPTSPIYLVDDSTGRTVVTIIFMDGEIKNRWLKTIIDASQVSANGLDLDGDLPSPLTLPSGDGTAGGNAEFIIGNRFGDVDGNYRCLLNDAVLVRNHVSGAVLVGISNAYDLDKNERVLLNDAVLTRNAVSGAALPSLP